MRGVAGARIWYQSFTDPDADRPYFTRLEAYLGSVASPGCQVEVFDIQPHRHQPPHRLRAAAGRGGGRIPPRFPNRPAITWYR